MENKLLEEDIRAIGATLIKNETDAVQVIGACVNNNMDIEDLIKLVTIPILYAEGKDEFYLLQNSPSTGIKDHFLYFAFYGYSTEIPDENNINKETADKIRDIATVIKGKLKEIEKSGNSLNILEKLYPQGGPLNIFLPFYPGEEWDKEKAEKLFVYPFQKYGSVSEVKHEFLFKKNSDEFMPYLKINVENPYQNLRPLENVRQDVKKYVLKIGEFMDIIGKHQKEQKPEEMQKYNRDLPTKPDHKQKPKLKL